MISEVLESPEPLHSSPAKMKETPSTLKSQISSGNANRSVLEDIDPNCLFENFNSLVKVTIEPEELTQSQPISRQLNYEQQDNENASDEQLQPQSIQKPKRYRDEQAHRLIIRPIEFANQSNHSEEFEKIVLGSGWCRCVDSDSDM